MSEFVQARKDDAFKDWSGIDIFYGDIEKIDGAVNLETARGDARHTDGRRSVRNLDLCGAVYWRTQRSIQNPYENKSHVGAGSYPVHKRSGARGDESPGGYTGADENCRAVAAGDAR